MNYRVHLGAILTLAGLVPFMGLAILMSVPQTIISPDLIFNMFQNYGFLISVFIAGSHWGIHFSQQNDWQLILPISSNLITLMLWAALSFLDIHGRLWILVISFLGLLLVDRGLYNDDVISKPYFFIRVWATLVVTICIMTMKVSL